MAESVRLEPGERRFSSALRGRSGWLRLPPVELAFPPLALVLWALSLDRISVEGMNDLGLVSVLPVLYYAAFATLTCGFVSSLRGAKVSQVAVFLHIAAMIVILFATTSAVEEAPRFAATWKHIGITEYIIRNEQLDTRLDAYFSWPGAFILAALLTELTGVDDPSALAGWASLVFNALYLAPLYVIFKSIVRDERARWFGIWLFYLGNWIGQDYFAPQALDYLLYLSVLAILLHWFPMPLSAEPSRFRAWTAAHLERFPVVSRQLAAASEIDGDTGLAGPWQRVGLMLATLLIIAAMAPSHQLTPVALVIMLGALVIFRRIQPTGIALYAGLVVGSWIAFATVPFLLGHLEGVASGVGQLSGNVNAGVAGRVSGSREHVFVVQMRLVMAVAYIILAGIGIVMRVCSGRWDIVPILLAGAPVVILGLQAYGGEGVLRAFFFALPGLALLAALAIYARPGQTQLRTSLVAGALSLVLFGGFLFARFGNERMDYYTAEEVAAIAYLYAEAPEGAVLVAGGPSVPWKAERYEDLSERVIPARMIREGDPDQIATYMREVRETNRNEVYFVVTRATSAAVDIFYGLETGALDHLVDELLESGEFRAVLDTDDATILVLSEPLDSTAFNSSE